MDDDAVADAVADGAPGVDSAGGDGRREPVPQADAPEFGSPAQALARGEQHPAPDLSDDTGGRQAVPPTGTRGGPVMDEQAVETASPPGGGLSRALRLLVVVGLLYAFLAGVYLLSSGISGLGSGFADALLDRVEHPLAGLAVGMLFTVLVQSSSVSTAAVVALVGTGVVPLSVAVPMVMGTNLGTTVTSTLAALGNIGDKPAFRRGFAAATMHDMFNLLAVAVLFPLELATGVLQRAATALTVGLAGGGEVRQPGPSPIRTAIRAPANLAADLVERLGVQGAWAGVLLLLVGLLVIFAALGSITRQMRAAVGGNLEETVNRTLSRGSGVLALVLGAGATIAVQSSTIVTAMLVPMVASGILLLPNAFPITLGANVGTTVTGLLASLAVDLPEGLTIALVHSLFNVTAILLIYPAKRIRRLPLRGAELLADVAAERPVIVGAYVVGLFLVLPVVIILLAG
jgi:solute carrier family 34 (sodium-dependent phosphate cotransporter)